MIRKSPSTDVELANSLTASTDRSSWLKPAIFQLADSSASRRKESTTEDSLVTRPQSSGLETPPINSERLITFCTHRFDKTVHHDIVLQCHTQLSGEAARECGLHDVQDKHFCDSGSAIFLHHPKGDETAGPRLQFQIIEKLD